MTAPARAAVLPAAAARIRARKPAWFTTAACAALLGCFALLSASAARTKSATADEPLHLMGGFMHRNYFDFSVNIEDPALFGWIFALPLPKDALRVDRDSIFYRQIPTDIGNQAFFNWQTLYKTPGNDEQLVLNRARTVGTLLGVLLGAVIAWWAYQLAGPVAAVASTALFAFDPNFLAHASLVKNDVPLSLCLAATMFAVWRAGRRATPLNLAALALLAAAAVGMKFSGLLAAPILGAALLARAALPESWPVLNFNLTSRAARLTAAACVWIGCAVVAVVVLWGVYGFRYLPTSDPARRFDVPRLALFASVKELMIPHIRAQVAAGETNPTNDFADRISPEQVYAHRPAVVVRFARWADEHHLLPQAWLAGFLYTYATTLVRSTYLNGHIQHIGWWYYFPLAMLYKTPIATLIAIVLAPLALLLRFITCREPSGSAAGPDHPRNNQWSIIALAVAPLIYSAFALASNLNLGLRHILPVYPFIYIAIGVVAAKVVRRRRLVGLVTCAAIAIGLVVETTRAWPDYIAFFNTAAGGSLGGFKLLGDSNLDWGQDLKLLAAWQRLHPDERLYLSYFGAADPEYYGVRAIHVPGGYSMIEEQHQLPTQPGIIAVSATNLQGQYFEPQMRDAYRAFRAAEPIGVLGGTIYLYHFPLPAPTTAPSR